LLLATRSLEDRDKTGSSESDLERFTDPSNADKLPGQQDKKMMSDVLGKKQAADKAIEDDVRSLFAQPRRITTDDPHIADRTKHSSRQKTSRNKPTRTRSTARNHTGLRSRLARFPISFDFVLGITERNTRLVSSRLLLFLVFRRLFR
jgi:hypothetical protein